MTDFTLNQLIAYSQHNLAPQRLGGPYPSLIHWDMRRPTEQARYVDNAEQALTFADLGQVATQPPLQSLEVHCGFFPASWSTTMHRPEGVTVEDVLEAIHANMKRRISRVEWNALSQREQHRIKVVFDARWQAAEDSDECRQNGVLRMDCLLQHTLFGGLSILPDTQDKCILSLRRHH